MTRFGKPMQIRRFFPQGTSPESVLRSPPAWSVRSFPPGLSFPAVGRRRQCGHRALRWRLVSPGRRKSQGCEGKRKHYLSELWMRRMITSVQYYLNYSNSRVRRKVLSHRIKRVKPYTKQIPK